MNLNYEQLGEQAQRPKSLSIHNGMTNAIERLHSLLAHLRSIHDRMVGPQPEAPTQSDRSPTFVEMPIAMDALINQIEKVTSEIEGKLF